MHGLKFLQFNLFLSCPEIIHASFTRLGGVSLGPYASLNVSYHVGDKDEHVDANRERIKKTLQLKSLLDSVQCHGADVHVIKDAKAPIPSCDALITQMPEIGLLIKHADCQAAIFYDPVQKVIGNAHAGWKGSIQKIYTATIFRMQSEFGCNPANILVAISPSLGPMDAEFKNFRTELPEQFWKYQIKPTYFDFWEISRQELLDAGVLPEHIEIAKISTLSNPDYFSYRREKASGRLATVIALKE